MSVKLNIDAHFLGKEEAAPVNVEVTGGTIGECLEQLMTKEPSVRKMVFDDIGELRPTTNIFVNTVPVFVRQLLRVVKDGDEIGVRHIASASC